MLCFLVSWSSEISLQDVEGEAKLIDITLHIRLCSSGHDHVPHEWAAF